VLASERWRAPRAEVIRRAGHSCACCGRGGWLDVHHAHGYRNLGREQLEELQALCRDCHTALHGSRELVNVGCLCTLFWAVIIAVGMQVAWRLAASVVHGPGVFLGLFRIRVRSALHCTLPQASRRWRAPSRHNPPRDGRLRARRSVRRDHFQWWVYATCQRSSTRSARPAQRSGPAGDQPCPAVYGPLRKWSRTPAAPELLGMATPSARGPAFHAGNTAAS
jgi:hypothetical protein